MGPKHLFARLTLLTAGAAFTFASVGCSTMNQTEKGVLGGGAIGAGVGTLIGHATGNPKTGAVVGGLLGAGVGGTAGMPSTSSRTRAYRGGVEPLRSPSTGGGARSVRGGAHRLRGARTRSAPPGRGRAGRWGDD